MAVGVLDNDPQGHTLCQRIARALHALDPEHLPETVVAKAKLCLFDFLACALSSRELPWARQALAFASRHASNRSQAATLIGTPHRVEAGAAAFANAVLGHGLVRDDMHLGSVSHLGVIVLPPVLALAETRSVPGRALLAAIACGYEAGGKLGRLILDVEISRIFRPTGITGPFAAAAGAAKLLGLSERETVAALALAANTASGYNEWAVTGGSEMFFHPGFAARNGLTAAALAAAGASVSASALDGERGLLAAFHKFPAAPPPAPFAEKFEILDVFFKEVPACNFAQTSAQVARAIALGWSIDAEAIERVLVRVPYAAAHYPGCDNAGPIERILQAKMSIQYNVAAALITRAHDEPSYEPSQHPEIRRLATRVALEIDPELTAAFPAKQSAEVVVELRGGERCRRRADDVRPAAAELVRERFTAAAAATFGDTAARKLVEFIESLEQLPDTRALGGLLRANGPRS